MKIDRLIGILSVLLQEEKVTAPKLAEKFEVSRRTISKTSAKPEFRSGRNRAREAVSVLWTVTGWTGRC